MGPSELIDLGGLYGRWWPRPRLETRRGWAAKNRRWRGSFSAGGLHNGLPGESETSGNGEGRRAAYDVKRN